MPSNWLTLTRDLTPLILQVPDRCRDRHPTDHWPDDRDLEAKEAHDWL
jgi:hypothetical protein